MNAVKMLALQSAALRELELFVLLPILARFSALVPLRAIDEFASTASKLGHGRMEDALARSFVVQAAA